MTHDSPIPDPWNHENKFWKARYIEYTNSSFSTKSSQPAFLGIQGPTFRAEVGDTIEIHFCNHVEPPADARGYPGSLNCEKRGISMHPHGVKYDKNDEGAVYKPSGSGASIAFGDCFTYKWEVPETSGPLPDEPSSIVWLYHSHVDEDRDPRAGLYGSIVVTRKGFAKSTSDPSPKDVDHEFPLVLFVHNENWGEDNQESNMIHTINGFFFGNLRGLTMQEDQKVRWYVIGLGTEVDLHTVSINAKPQKKKNR